MSKMPPLVLVAAVFVLQHKLPAVSPENVGSIISNFLVADISLARACELSPTGSLALLDLVWRRSLRHTSYWNIARLLVTEPHYRQWIFCQSMHKAAKRGDFHMVQWLLDHFPGWRISENIVQAAAGCGHLSLLQLLETDKTRGVIPWTQSSLNEAAKERHWNVVHWLHDRSNNTLETIEANTKLVGRAFQQGNMEQLKWTLRSGYKAHSDHFYYPSISRSTWTWSQFVEILHLVIDGGHDGGSVACDVLSDVAEMGDLECMQWLVSYMEVNYFEVPMDEVALSAVDAFEWGHLELGQWLIVYVTNSDVDVHVELSMAMFQAAKRGKLNVVKWLYETYASDPSINLVDWCDEIGDNDPHAETAMDIAASNGHLHVVQYIHDVNAASLKKQKLRKDDTPSGFHGKEVCTPSAMDTAAANGHLEVVKWLHTNRSEGCTTDAMDFAAMNGHLEVVKWLHLNRNEGCTSVANTFLTKRKFRQWLYVNRSKCVGGPIKHSNSDGSRKTRKYIVKSTDATKRKRMDVGEWLHQNDGFATMDNAAADGNLKALKWLYTNQAGKCSATALKMAVKGGHMQVVRWLITHFEELPIMEAMELAICGNHFEMTLFIWAQRRPHAYTGFMRTLRDQIPSRRYLDNRDILAWLEEHI